MEKAGTHENFREKMSSKVRPCKCSFFSLSPFSPPFYSHREKLTLICADKPKTVHICPLSSAGSGISAFSLEFPYVYLLTEGMEHVKIVEEDR
jgi:hypothetical protein